MTFCISRARRFLGFIFSQAGDGLPAVFLCNFLTLIAAGIRHGGENEKTSANVSSELKTDKFLLRFQVSICFVGISKRVLSECLESSI